MKKLIALTMAAAMLLAVLTGCASKKPEAETPGTAEPGASEDAGTAESAGLKTGLGVIASAGSSKEEEGLAQADVLMAAVLLGGDGKIVDCKIDSVQAKINFTTEGKLETAPDTVFASKNELGADYGMGKASAIGKEWNEQAEAFAQYVIGKTADEVGGIAMTEGKASDADLASSVTIHIGDFIAVVQKAAANAQDLGAQTGDNLKLASVTEMSSSKDASADAAGLAQAYVSMTAATFDADTISSCVIDAVQVNVEFDQAGKITSDLAGEIKTKDELGADYGMAKASSIGKEWNEQAAAFAQYVTGKTVKDVQGIAVSEGKASDADLASSVTIHINVFQQLLEKAGA